MEQALPARLCLSVHDSPPTAADKGLALEIGNLCYLGDEGQILLQAMPARLCLPGTRFGLNYLPFLSRRSRFSLAQSDREVPVFSGLSDSCIIMPGSSDMTF